MTFAPKFDPNEPLLPKPRSKPIQVGEFDKPFVWPVVRGREPSAVDLLAAVVDEKARERVERQRRGTAYKTLSNAKIASVLPMCGPATVPEFYRVQRRQQR